jgi:hypothetical protein
MNNEHSLKIRGRYHLLPVILKLKDGGWTNEQIGDLLGCHTSSVKYAIRHNQPSETIDGLVEFGEPDPEWLRVAAVHKCLEFLTVRGWQVGEADAKCVYDVFGLKGTRTITIQVRSGSKMSKRGWPMFKTYRMLFNTKRMVKLPFSPGDFDYWFFYGPKRDAWMIPFNKIISKHEVSMEGYDEFYVG